MQPDLGPEAAEAFEIAVSLAVEASERPSEEAAFVVGVAFARFHDLVDGRDPATYETLKTAVYDAAAEAVLRAADLPADS